MSELHVWSRCHACASRPILGRAWRCTTCPAGPENDLCESCFSKYRQGQVQHPSDASFAAPLAKVGPHNFERLQGEPISRFAGWRDTEMPTTQVPETPRRFVLRPEFLVGSDSFLGSYGCAAEVDGETLLLTAFHLLHPIAQHLGIDCTTGNLAYTGRELAQKVNEVRLYDPFSEQWIFAELGTAGPMLVLPGARLGDPEPLSQRDLAIFQIGAKAQVAAQPLGTGRPAVGDPIWLVTRPQGERSGRSLAAVTVESSEDVFAFRFADPDVDAPFTSGAPLVDAAGTVVGINVGAGYLGTSKLGHACHCDSIRSLLAARA